MKLDFNTSSYEYTTFVIHKYTQNDIVIVKNVNRDEYEQIMIRLGDIVALDEDPYSLNKTGERFIDIQYDKNMGGFSYRHSNKHQPLHTDGAYESAPSDICSLFCIEKANFGGATLFVSQKQIIDILSIYDVNMLDSLKEEQVLFEKGNDSRMSRIIDGDNINWNYFRVSKSNPPKIIKLCKKFHTFLEEYIMMGGICERVLLKQNQAVFFRDNRWLHGRYSFVGNRYLIKGGIHCLNG